ncbi:hypothetical protein FGO68_gene17147 [Halteria grandinella]|uniref:Uncharacterized protein n=1 Tax=Halteria grandinella TaxID=5974 RepID=A0A8J8T8G7_HALGN|nr:hypothetical protein FGO68_gene17147 [Halteria grandinella]
MQKRNHGVFKKKTRQTIENSSIKNKCDQSIALIPLQSDKLTIEFSSDYQIISRYQDYYVLYSAQLNTSYIMQTHSTDCYAQLPGIKVDHIFFHDTRLICNSEVYTLQRGKSLEHLSTLQIKFPLTDGCELDQNTFLFTLQKHANLFVMKYDKDKHCYKKIKSLNLRYRTLVNKNHKITKLQRIDSTCYCLIMSEIAKFDINFVISDDEKYTKQIKYAVVPHEYIYADPNNLELTDLMLAPDKIHVICQNVKGLIVVVDQFTGQVVSKVEYSSLELRMVGNFDYLSFPILIANQRQGLKVVDVAESGIQGEVKMEEGVDVVGMIGGEGDKVWVACVNKGTREVCRQVIQLQCD